MLCRWCLLRCCVVRSVCRVQPPQLCVLFAKVGDCFFIRTGKPMGFPHQFAVVCVVREGLEVPRAVIACGAVCWIRVFMCEGVRDAIFWGLDVAAVCRAPDRAQWSAHGRIVLSHVC